MKWTKIIREKWYPKYEGFVVTKIYKVYWWGERKLLHNYEVYTPLSKQWHWLNESRKIKQQ